MPERREMITLGALVLCDLPTDKRETIEIALFDSSYFNNQYFDDFYPSLNSERSMPFVRHTLEPRFLLG